MMNGKYRKLLISNNPNGVGGDKCKKYIWLLSEILILLLAGGISLSSFFYTFMKSDYAVFIIMTMVMPLLLIGFNSIVRWKNLIFNEKTIPYIFFMNRTARIKHYLLQSSHMNSLPFQFEFKNLTALHHPYKNKILSDLLMYPELASLPVIKHLYSDQLENVEKELNKQKKLRHKELFKLKERIDNGEFQEDRIAFWLIIIIALSFVLSLAAIKHLAIWYISTLVFLILTPYLMYRLCNHKGFLSLQHYINKKFDLWIIPNSFEQSSADSLREKLRQSPQLSYLWNIVKSRDYLCHDEHLINALFDVNVRLKTDKDLKSLTIDRIKSYLRNEYEQAEQWDFTSDNVEDWGDAYLASLDNKVHHSLEKKFLVNK